MIYRKILMSCMDTQTTNVGHTLNSDDWEIQYK